MNIYKPCIVVLSGMPFVGKTTLGQAICNNSNFSFCDVEKARKQIEGSGAWLGEEKEKEIMLAAYRLNHTWVKQKLHDGHPVLIAATYSRPIYHEMLTSLQREARIPLKVFLLTCPSNILKERVLTRTKDNPSNLRTVEELQTVLSRYVPYPHIVTTIDTTQPLQECVAQIFEYLADVQLESN